MLSSYFVADVGAPDSVPLIFIHKKEETTKQKTIVEKPDKIITIGGNCIVSLAPFDYLHGIYKNVGIIWIDAHPDVTLCSCNGIR